MFVLESTSDGAATILNEGVSSGTTVYGEAVALTGGASPVATLAAATVRPDAVIVAGNTDGEAVSFIKVRDDQTFAVPVTAADGVTALSGAQETAFLGTIGNQAARISATGLTLDGVTANGGKVEVVSYDPNTKKARVKFHV